MAEEEAPRIKVTDRRMFTESGELREDLEDVPEEAEEAEEAERSRSAGAESRPPGGAQPPGGGRGAGPAAGGGGVSEPPPGYGTSRQVPQFLDLVAMLAEPAALFLGDATIPGQEPMEDLERARMHIDLLAMLEEKCQGNLSAQESAVLQDLLYRLRMRYVEKRG